MENETTHINQVNVCMFCVCALYASNKMVNRSEKFRNLLHYWISLWRRVPDDDFLANRKTIINHKLAGDKYRIAVNFYVWIEIVDAGQAIR